MVRFRVADNGALRMVSLETDLAQRLYDQSAADDLAPASMARFHHHRYHYEVTFHSKARERGAVLLGADSENNLQVQARHLLADPDSVGTDAFARCVAFPRTCTVSLEMEGIVNGAARTAVWGSTLASVVVHPRRLDTMRKYSGHPTPVEIPPGGPQALRLPLLPGDQARWQ